MSRAFAVAAVICAFLATAHAAGRHLNQNVNCDGDAATKACEKVQCNGGVMKPECDSTTGSITCTCQSAGLASCFPGSATVALASGAARRLSDLELGDRVLAVGADGRLRYSPVVMFSSARPHERAAFLRVHTEAGLAVTVTPGHYLFAWKGAGGNDSAAQAALLSPAAWPYVLPTQLEVGDWVPVAGAAAAAAASGRPTLTRVTAVERLLGDGVFMPHTLTGAIVVDGVVASELTSVVPPGLAGPRFQRGLAATLRLAAAVLPARAVETVVRGVSSWAHGAPDASVLAAALAAVPASA